MEACAAEKKEEDGLCVPMWNNLRMTKMDVEMVTTMAAATEEALSTYCVLGVAL